MDIGHAETVFDHHSKASWPDASTIVADANERALAISIGTEAQPVLVLITVREDEGCPTVELVTKLDLVTNERTPIMGLRDPRVIARLGGTLIQVSNVVDQLMGVEQLTAVGGAA